MSISRIVVVGTSAGGVGALQRLFSSLHPEFSLPLVVVQHIPADTVVKMDLVYGSQIPKGIVAVPAEDKTELMPRHFYFAPANYHLLVESQGTLALSQEEPVHFSRPSIDVTFESVAEAYTTNAIGVLMTGANADGASGLHEIHRRGGITFVEDPKGAEVAVMPRAALKLFDPTYVCAIEQIAEKLSAIDRGGTRG